MTVVGMFAVRRCRAPQTFDDVEIGRAPGRRPPGSYQRVLDDDD